MASKISFLDRVLALTDRRLLAYAHSFATAGGRDAATVAGRNAPPGELRCQLQQAGNVVYGAIQRLSPQNDTQASLKSQAASLAIDVAQIRSLLAAQSVPSISKPMLIILVLWLVIIFLGFSVLAPPNATTLLALTVRLLPSPGYFPDPRVGSALRRLIRISSQPMVNALHQLAK